MATTVPIHDSAPSFDRVLCVVLQQGQGGSDSLTGIQLRSYVPVEEMTNVPHGDYTGIPNTASRRVTGPVSQAMTPDPVDCDPQSVQHSQATITSHDHGRQLGPSPLRGNNNSFASEAPISTETRRPAADGEDRDSSEGLPVRHKVARIRVALLVVGAVSLVIVPGLVLGVVTEQIPWGIALSGAIATMVSFFAGLFYYHNK